MRVRRVADAQDEQVFLACVRYGVLGSGGYVNQRVFSNRLLLRV